MVWVACAHTCVDRCGFGCRWERSFHNQVQSPTAFIPCISHMHSPSMVMGASQLLQHPVRPYTCGLPLPLHLQPTPTGPASDPDSAPRSRPWKVAPSPAHLGEQCLPVGAHPSHAMLPPMARALPLCSRSCPPCLAPRTQPGESHNSLSRKPGLVPSLAQLWEGFLSPHPGAHRCPHQVPPLSVPLLSFALLLAA